MNSLMQARAEAVGERSTGSAVASARDHGALGCYAADQRLARMNAGRMLQGPRHRSIPPLSPAEFIGAQC
jgi:hypothetical protein